jgi:ADP-heptose:LPS heptosyltransferase
LPDDGWKTDWAVTASHMKAMKGVVTVDTGTAHLAGALGVKTIVLLPKEEFVCWRWKNGRWYDSVIALRPDEYHKVPELIRRM